LVLPAYDVLLDWLKIGNKKSLPPFYSSIIIVDAPLPIFLSAVMGLQHAMAMVGGLITPPFVIFKFTVAFSDVAAQQYIISAALITCGFCTIINVLHFPIPFSSRLIGRQLYLGSGVLSVMGTSFTFLPIFEISISQMKANGIEGFEAYGKMLGTAMICSLLELFLSLLPIKIIVTLIPPLVSSITVMLIGIALTGTGMKYWGGGVVCADMIWKQHMQTDGKNITQIPGPICTNGDVQLGYGSAEFIGLGFSVMVFLVLLELFGSTFMRNCNVILALIFGYFVAAVSNYQGNPYVQVSSILEAAPITFLWVEWFGLGFYGPAVIPLMIGFLVTTTETIGKFTSFEIS